VVQKDKTGGGLRKETTREKRPAEKERGKKECTWDGDNSLGKHAKKFSARHRNLAKDIQTVLDGSATVPPGTKGKRKEKPRQRSRPGTLNLQKGNYRNNNVLK